MGMLLKDLKAQFGIAPGTDHSTLSRSPLVNPFGVSPKGNQNSGNKHAQIQQEQTLDTFLLHRNP